MAQSPRFPWIALVLISLVILTGFQLGNPALQGLDRLLTERFALQREAGSDTAIAVWQGVSWIGGGARRYLVALAFAAFLAWKGWRVRAAVLIGATLVANLLSDGLKDFFARARPDLVPHLDHASSASFPSGHATSGALIYIAFALLLPSRHRPLLLTAACVVAVLMAASRIALGVHWTSDVFAGLALGTAVALIAQWSALRIEAR